MHPSSERAAAVLRALRAAHGTLSQEQISAETGIDVWAVEDLLIQLQIQGLAHCVATPSRPRGRPRQKLELWKAARPDLA